MQNAPELRGHQQTDSRLAGVQSQGQLEAKADRGRHDIFQTMRIAGCNIRLLAPLLVGVLISAPVVRSQSGVTLSGNVMDVSGGIVPGASVQLYSVKGFRETKTNNRATFEFVNVDPGKYELEVTSPGFRSVTIKDIEIIDKTPEPLSIKLHVGSGGHCTVMGLGGPGESRFSAGANISYEERVDKVDVRGLVRDDLGSALVGVKVKLEGGGQIRTAVSNGRGEFEFSGVDPSKYTLTSSQVGFWDISRYVWIMQKNLSRVIVTLPDKRRVPCFEFSGP
jgi:hypothetical protein